MIKIYKLIYKGDIIYVGKTKLTLKRRKSSSNYSVPKEIYKECLIELIEEVDDVSRERYWIDFYIKSGINLMNKRGGDTKIGYTKLINKQKKELRGFVKKTPEEHRETRRLYRLKKRDELNKKRRERYRQKKDSKLPKLL